MPKYIRPTGCMSAISLETGKRRWLSPVDIITLLFCGWILIYILIGNARVLDFGLHFASYLSIFTGVLLSAVLERWWEGREGWFYTVFRLLRALYPVLLFGYFYSSNYAFNRVLIPQWQDPFFMKIDQAIFGYLPSMEWGVRHSHWAISELFHGAYFCYYPMIAGLPLYLYLKDRKAFMELIFVLTFSFYIFYLMYSILPTIGGRYIPEAHELTKVYRAGPFTHIMALIYNQSQHWGGAFPSSHVGITIVLTIAGLRFTRRMGYVFVVISFFLSLSIAYCHYHWFIDAVGGIIVGIAAYYLGLWVYQKMLPVEAHQQ